MEEKNRTQFTHSLSGRNRPAVLVSACLLGVSCKYDGGHNRNEQVTALKERFHLVPVCPEQLGGLPTPRIPSEIRDGRVFAKDGTDVTENFARGAHEALRLAQLAGCRCAVLKARSPSCGSGVIYDGTFSGTKTEGDGVTAALLKRQGIRVYTEDEAEFL